MQMIQTTTRRLDRRMPGHYRRNVGYSHVDQQWFFLVILTGLIFFVANKATGSQDHSTYVSDVVSGVISEGTVRHKSATECPRNFQSSSSCFSIHNRSAGAQQRYLPRRQGVQERLETEVKYNLNSYSEACCKDSVEKLGSNDSTGPIRNVKGSLRRNIDFWRSINAYESVLDMIENGVKVPFIETPSSKVFKNDKSALDNAEFVQETILDLLKTGRILETFTPCTVINPLTVSVNATGKKILILDLRYINQFVWKQTFKLDDWRVLFEYAHKGDFMFVWDLSSGYHHLDLFVGHQQYFGFSFEFQGRIRYFFFTVLMFGLSTGPYIFTKLLRPLVKHWREQGIKTAVYLDDGAGVCDTFEKCVDQAKQVKTDLQSAGFIINNDKSVWVPCQCLVWLGLLWNLIKGVLEIPETRLLKVENAILNILNSLYGVSARKIVHLTGLLISLAPSLGNITQLIKAPQALRNTPPLLGAPKVIL